MPERNDAPEVFWCSKFVFRNAKIILAALQADSLNRRDDERIVPSHWIEDERCNMEGHGSVTYRCSEKMRPDDINRIYQWIEKMDEACDVMRGTRQQPPLRGEEDHFEYPY